MERGITQEGTLRMDTCRKCLLHLPQNETYTKIFIFHEERVFMNNEIHDRFMIVVQYSTYTYVRIMVHHTFMCTKWTES